MCSSLLNVFVFFLKKFLLCGDVHRENKWRTFSEKAVVENHDHFLSSYHYLRCMWLRLSVCACVCVFVRIHQSVIWNYFWQRRSILIAFFFGTEKKKIALFHFGSSAPLAWLSPISYLVVISLCSSGNNILLFIYSCCFMWWWTDRVWAGNQKWNRVLLPVGPDRGPQYETTLAGRKSQKAGTNWTFAKTSSLFVQPSCCSLFDVQHSRKLPDPAGGSSRQTGWDTIKRKKKKTTAGHQHCNFLTYNKAISYFLPYKWK